MTRVKVTARVSTIEYAIRDIMTHTEHLLQAGKKLYCLNIGDPGAFDFPAPEHVKQALCKAVEENDSYYSPSEGLPELREAIAKKEKCVNARIGLGGVGSTPIRAKKAEAMLKGKKITEDLLVEAGRAASEESSPVSGIEASAEYKRELAGTLVKRVGKIALERAQKA